VAVTFVEFERDDFLWGVVALIEYTMLVILLHLNLIF
jgi:hypothetical protein